MATQRINLTRDQLAKFLVDQEQIRQFEKLFANINLIPVESGGTGETNYTNGDLLIGNTPGLSKNKLTPGTGIDVTNGPGTITLAITNTTVTPGSYTYASFTVDAKGRLTAASSGTAPVTSIGVTAPVTTTGGATPTIGISGITATIITAKLTTVGTNGSMTFTNGVLTAQTPAT